MNWYLKVLNQYADFSGRARRKEYWMFTLISTLIVWGIQLITIGLDLDTFVYIQYIYSLLVLVPSLAVLVRRLHDIGKSGWYFLIIFIPLAGPIWLLVLLCMEGEGRPNQWGENPKGMGNDRNIDLIGRE